MINIILFSKDRPLQAEACLASLFHHHQGEDAALNVSVVWKASSQAFKGGYEALQVTQTQNMGTRWVEEIGSLREALSACDYQFPLTMFLVDDDVFRAPWSADAEVIKYLDWPGVLTVSLRLDRNMTWCYPVNGPQAIPSMMKGCVWDWTKGMGDWGYPMSVDGNIFKTETILGIMSQIGFSNPNAFEGALDGFVKNNVAFKSKYPMMCCYDAGRSRLINVPANRVQNNANNRVEDSFSAEFLLKKFNEGYSIDFLAPEIVEDEAIISCHWPMEYKFRKLK